MCWNCAIFVVSDVRPRSYCVLQLLQCGVWLKLVCMGRACVSDCAGCTGTLDAQAPNRGGSDMRAGYLPGKSSLYFSAWCHSSLQPSLPPSRFFNTTCVPKCIPHSMPFLPLSFPSVCSSTQCLTFFFHRLLCQGQDGSEAVTVLVRSKLVVFIGQVLKIPGFNPLTPNDPCRGRTAPLTSKRCILCIFSTNIGTEYFKHGIYSSFFSSSKCSLFHNSNVFGLGIIHIVYTGVLKLKKKQFRRQKVRYWTF